MTTAACNVAEHMLGLRADTAVSMGIDNGSFNGSCVMVVCEQAAACTCCDRCIPSDKVLAQDMETTTVIARASQHCGIQLCFITRYICHETCEAPGGTACRRSCSPAALPLPVTNSRCPWLLTIAVSDHCARRRTWPLT